MLPCSTIFPQLMDQYLPVTRNNITNVLRSICMIYASKHRIHDSIYCIVLYCMILYCIILCYIILYYTILYYIYTIFSMFYNMLYYYDIYISCINTKGSTWFVAILSTPGEAPTYSNTETVQSAVQKCDQAIHCHLPIPRMEMNQFFFEAV